MQEDTSLPNARHLHYLDFELEITHGSGREYPVTLVQSPAGEAQETLRLPFDAQELERGCQTLQQVFQSLEAEQTVQSFGQRLFDALLAGEVRKRYNVSTHEAARQSKGLRLKLRIYPPELTALPWEFMYDSHRAEYVSLSKNTLVVRYMKFPSWVGLSVQPLTVTPPLRILGMIASPHDLPPLDVAREKQQLEEAIKDLQAFNLVSLSWLPEQTWHNVQQAVRKNFWHIFHFIGYGRDVEIGWPGSGQRAGAIALADEYGQQQWLIATELRGLLADHVGLTVLNLRKEIRASVHNISHMGEAEEKFETKQFRQALTILRRIFRQNPSQQTPREDDTVSVSKHSDTSYDIFSRTASSLLHSGMLAVLAMQPDISDRAAVEFCHAFYEAVAHGTPVDVAVAEARQAVRRVVANTVEWGTPVLYMRSPDGRIFDIKAAGLYLEAQLAMAREDWGIAIEKVQAALALAPTFTKAAVMLRQARQRQNDVAPASSASASRGEGARSIFISYAREDRDAALLIYELLKRNNFSPWIDIYNLLPGQDWELEINKVIRNSVIFIACLSRNAIAKRGYVQSELNKALKVLETIPESQIFLIPVRLDSCEIPVKLEHLHCLDYFTEEGPRKLVQAITHYLVTEAEVTKQAPQSSGLAFANIAIDASNAYWGELLKPQGYPFDRECSQYFRLTEFVSNADPSFDVTVLNMSNTPVLLTAVGVEVVSAAHITYVAGTRVPKAVKVRKEATYTIEVPDLWTKLGRLELARIDLHALVSTRVADPVYLEVMAPFRYGLYLERYIQHLPNRTILRLWARTNRGEEQSQELYLERH